MLPTLLRPVLALAALALLATPAHAQDAEPQPCRQVRVKAPDRPRREDVVSDSLRRVVREELLARARAAGVSRPEGLLVFSGDPARGPVQLHAYQANLPNALLAGVAEWVAEPLARWPRRGPLHLTVRLDSLPVPETPVGAMRTECPPVMTDRNYLRQRMEAYFRGRGYIGGFSHGSLTTMVRITLARDGEQAYAWVDRPSGDGAFDDFALETAREAHFLPARVNGVPVDMEITLPLSLSMQAPRSRP